MSCAMVFGMVSTRHNLVGLARVFTVVEAAQLQRDALTAAGCGRRGRLGSLVDDPDRRAA